MECPHLRPSKRQSCHSSLNISVRIIFVMIMVMLVVMMVGVAKLTMIMVVAMGLVFHRPFQKGRDGQSGQLPGSAHLGCQFPQWSP